jgi:hypothetical protein
MSNMSKPEVTICVLTYGNYAALAKRVLDSIRQFCPRSEYTLVVGANSVCRETRRYLDAQAAAGDIDHLLVSPVNLNQCPMMRRMFAHVQTPFIWWFDDDSYVTEPGALERWLKAAHQAPESTVEWGPIGWCGSTAAFAPELDDAVGFVRAADWYRGLPPPSWRLGGKGQFNHAGLGTGDGTWLFIPGGCWLMRTSVIHALDWPDRRLIKMGNDVFLGEAIRQQGWQIQDIGSPGVAVNTEPRRGEPGLTRVQDVVTARTQTAIRGALRRSHPSPRPSPR